MYIWMKTSMATIDEEFWFELGCWYEEVANRNGRMRGCEDWEDNCELSDDLAPLPAARPITEEGVVSVLTRWAARPSPGHCWELCKCRYGDELVAIDWEADTGDCWCQDDCECMDDVGEATTILITRDSVVPALPQICDDDHHDGNGDEDCD